MNKILKRILTYLGILILFSIIYFLSFRLPLDSVITVYTYRGIFLLLIVSFLMLVILFLLKKFVFKDIDVKDIIIIILLFTLMHLLVFCMVPVTIERAYSVFMLSEISKAENQTMTIEECETLFLENYIKENDAIQKRFYEQMVTGTVVKTNEDTYKLTDKGNLIISLFNFFDKLYNVDSKLLK